MAPCLACDPRIDNMDGPIKPRAMQQAEAVWVVVAGGPLFQDGFRSPPAATASARSGTDRHGHALWHDGGPLAHLNFPQYNTFQRKLALQSATTAFCGNMNSNQVNCSQITPPLAWFRRLHGLIFLAPLTLVSKCLRCMIS